MSLASSSAILPVLVALSQDDEFRRVPVQLLVELIAQVNVVDSVELCKHLYMDRITQKCTKMN